MFKAVRAGQSHRLDGSLRNLRGVLDVQIQQAALLAVGPSQSSITISGPFSLPYQVLALADWNAQCYYTVHSSSGITINFSSPSPAGGGLLHYIVTGETGDFVAIAAGTVSAIPSVSSITISGKFPSSYMVAAQSSWSNVISVASTSTSSFTLSFSNAPPVGSTVDYLVVASPNTAITNSIAGNTFSFGSGTTSQSVTGSFVTPYQLFYTPSWDASVITSAKSPGAFTASFPDPGTGASVDYVMIQPATQVVAGVQQTLAMYLTDVRALLRDPAPGNTYSDADLTRFINRAIRQRDLDLGMNRSKFLFYLTIGKPDYNYDAIISSAQLLDGNPLLQPMDVLSFIVMPLGGISSSVRYPLGRKAYSSLSPFISTSYPTYPTWFCTYGPTTLFVAPPPANAYPCEIDFVGYSPDLVNQSDMDYMPYPYTDPVPFMACSFAKETLQRFDEAKVFQTIYEERMQRFRAGSRRISVSSPWSLS